MAARGSAHSIAAAVPAGREVPGSIPAARRTLVAAVFVFVLAAATVTWIEVVERLHAPDPIAARGRPAAIVWSDRVFRSEADLAAWLRGRGINYQRWVRSHPAAVKILRSRDRGAAEALAARTSGKRTAAAARAPKARAAPVVRGQPKPTPGQRPAPTQRFSRPADPGLGTPLSIAIIVGALALLVALFATAAPSATSAAITRLIRLRPPASAAPAPDAHSPRPR